MVSKFVRNRRKHLGLTQKQLADRAGVSVSVVQRFEASKPYSPRGKTALWIISALGVTSKDFQMLEWP
ncbi:helix-turn-helix transcriptional regulator [Brevibacillus sp. HD1.4A]|uniref:helix-turn-helix transcriptional regulator n=1 Tax=Brevibacillus sp. HD1.4A TaxID=2738978 RepID=UPI00352EF9C7